MLVKTHSREGIKMELVTYLKDIMTGEVVSEANGRILDKNFMVELAETECMLTRKHQLMDRLQDHPNCFALFFEVK